jgi:hypothetical protein
MRALFVPGRIEFDLQDLVTMPKSRPRGPMPIHRRWRLVLALLVTAVFAADIAVAQTQPPAEPAAAAPANPATPATPAKPKAKPKPKPKPAAAAPAPAAPAAAPAPETAEKPATPPAGGGAKPTLLGQYGEWGAYSASPSAKKVCFAIAKPTSSETNPPNRPRNPVYMFISTRPADKVANEVSIIIGYPFKAGTEATVDVGSTSFALYTQQDGAWIKNAAEEANMVDVMRSGDSAAVKGVSAKGTQTTDTYSLKGLAQALDRVHQDCP